MNWYITFSGSDYEATTRRIVEDAPKLGADRVLVYDDTWWFASEYFEALPQWLKQTRGKGCHWFVWKPAVIMHTLLHWASDGDVVLFTDADCYPIADLSVIYRIAARDGVMLFAASSHQNRSWCKRDCLIVMNQDEPRYIDTQHGVARFMAFQKGPWKPLQFLMEWLTYCMNYRATTFDPSVLGPEHPGFVEHRTEQAIFTLLAHRYGYKLHREACDAGEPPGAFPQDRDLYGQLFRQVHSTKGGIAAPGSQYRNVPLPGGWLP